MKDKNKLELRWSSVLSMLCLRDLGDTTWEKSSEQEALSLNTVTWRVYSRLLGRGRGAAGKQSLSVRIMAGVLDPVLRNQQGQRKQLPGQHMVSVGPTHLPRAWQIWWKAFPACHSFVFFFQQTMVKKEHHMSELDVNQMEGGSQEILVQIIGQTFLSSIKTVVKISIYKKPEFHFPLKKMKNHPGPLVDFILLVDRWGRSASYLIPSVGYRVQES